MRKYLYIKKDSTGLYIFFSDTRWPGYKRVTMEQLDWECLVAEPSESAKIVIRLK